MHVSRPLEHLSLSLCWHQNANLNDLRTGTLRRRFRSPLIASRPSTQQRTTDPQQPSRRCSYSSALFMEGGGLGNGPPAASLGSGWVAVEGPSNERPAEQLTGGDVPDTVFHNGETLTFGSYRRPRLTERAAITLAAFGTVGWKAFVMLRRTQRTWSRVGVAIVAPCLAWLLRSVMSFLYKEIVLQPKLRTPENVAFPNSHFKDIDDLKVHYLRETPKAEGADLLPRSVLHMNHGFGASSSSWAPVIRRLSAALGALTVAHDTPGFGLTARAPLWRTRRYSLDSNAAITRHLVQDAAGELDGSTGTRPSSRRYFLMGHSMGCITAATAALDSSLPPQQTTLVLVAPALSLPSKKTTRSVSEADAGAPTNGWEYGQGSGNKFLQRGSGGGGSGGVQRGIAGRVAREVVGAPVRALRAVRDTVVWVFNWCFLPLFYPIEILGLRALVYRGNFWRAALRLAWFDKSCVDRAVINRYRWPSLVRYWDRGFALFLLDRLQIGRGGTAGPSLVKLVGAKAAQGMSVVIVQGEKDTLVTLDKAKVIADAIPDSKLLVLPECGHVPHEERPDEFLRLVVGLVGKENAGVEKNATESDVAATS